jgi:hypothetical protein
MGPSFFADAVCWPARLFLAYSHGQPRLRLPAFTHLLARHCGVPEAFVCERYFRALDRGQRGALSFEDLVLGLVAMDPATPNAGPWRRLRAQYIFRAYDLDEDGDLSFHDFRLLVEDIMRFSLPPERRADPAAVDAPRAEAEARRFHAGGRCSRQDFVAAVESMAFRGTGVLFRVAQSPLARDPARRRALLEGAPPPPPPPASPSQQRPTTTWTWTAASAFCKLCDKGRPSSQFSVSVSSFLPAQASVAQLHGWCGRGRHPWRGPSHPGRTGLHRRRCTRVCDRQAVGAHKVDRHVLARLDWFHEERTFLLWLASVAQHYLASNPTTAISSCSRQ